MATSTAERVASCLINLSHEKQSPVSNLKLQKLLYYAQAWHLAIFKEPLFADEIEAWVHGPVVPIVFRRYRDYKWSPIDPVDATGLSRRTTRHLEEVWNAYGKFKAFELERMTHSEDPWRIARRGLAPDEPSHCVISRTSMQKYYSSLLHGQK